MPKFKKHAEVQLSGKLPQGFQLDCLIRNGAFQGRILYSVFLYFNGAFRFCLGVNQILCGDAVRLLEKIAKVFSIAKPRS